MPISRKGMCAFLDDVFINNTSALLTPTVLEGKLKNYENVGNIIYCLPRSSKAPPSKNEIVTVLQLIASEIISLSFDTYTQECSCQLVVVDAMPAYLTDVVWTRM